MGVLNPYVGVFPSERLHRQIDPDRARALHQRRAQLRIAEDEDLGRAQLLADPFTAGLVIDPGEHGDAGYITDYPIERFYRDVRLYRLYEGTSQIQQLIIARDMIKKAREKAGPSNS